VAVPLAEYFWILDWIFRPKILYARFFLNGKIFKRKVADEEISLQIRRMKQ
jgi:hypothetical protein